MTRTTLLPYRSLGMAWPRSWDELLAFPELSLPELAEEIRVDEFREDGSLVIRAEVPGIDPKKDVRVDVREGRLFVEVERRRESRVEEKDVIREEMRYGSFSRSLPLPLGCTEKDIKASYHNGILEVRVPMTELETKTIPIKTE